MKRSADDEWEQGQQNWAYSDDPFEHIDDAAVSAMMDEYESGLGSKPAYVDPFAGLADADMSAMMDEIEKPRVSPRPSASVPKASMTPAQAARMAASEQTARVLRRISRSKKPKKPVEQDFLGLKAMRRETAARKATLARGRSQAALAMSYKKPPRASSSGRGSRKTKPANPSFCPPSYYKQKKTKMPYKGRGTYFGKTLGSRLGGMTGIPGASAIGSRVGDWASSRVAKSKQYKDAKRRLLGRGLYTGRGLYSGRGRYRGRGAYEDLPVQSNSLIAGGASSIGVSGTADESETVTYTNHEYVSDIYGPDDDRFHVEQFPLNPGMSGVFPWLSQIAQNYEQHELVQTVFEYKPVIMDSSNNASGNTGSVIMATNYNAA